MLEVVSILTLQHSSLEVHLSGIQEILLIVLLILALIILPRIIPSRRQSTATDSSQDHGRRLSGKMRLALLLSFLWLLVVSAIYVLWQGQWAKYLYAGVGPLVLAWGLYWVLLGFCNNHRR